MNHRTNYGINKLWVCENFECGGKLNILISFGWINWIWRNPNPIALLLVEVSVNFGEFSTRFTFFFFVRKNLRNCMLIDFDSLAVYTLECIVWNIWRMQNSESYSLFHFLTDMNRIAKSTFSTWIFWECASFFAWSIFHAIFPLASFLSIFHLFWIVKKRRFITMLIST